MEVRDEYKEMVALVAKVVDAKLKKILPDMVKKEVASYMAGNKNSFNEGIMPRQEPIKPQHTNKKWTGNSVMDSILNQTANTQVNSKIPRSMIEAADAEHNQFMSQFDPTYNNGINNTSQTMSPTEAIQDYAYYAQYRGGDPNIATKMFKDYRKDLKVMENKAQTIRPAEPMRIVQPQQQMFDQNMVNQMVQQQVQQQLQSMQVNQGYQPQVPVNIPVNMGQDSFNRLPDFGSTARVKNDMGLNVAPTVGQPMNVFKEIVPPAPQGGPIGPPVGIPRVRKIADFDNYEPEGQY